MHWMRRSLTLFGIGAVLGPLGDFFHVISGTSGYPPSTGMIPFLKIPYWVPFEMGLAVLLIGLTHPAADKLFAKLGGHNQPPERSGARNWSWAIAGLIALLILWIATGF